MKKYIIINNKGSYYRSWTGIGPSFTQSLEEAEKFDDRMEAIKMFGRHSFAFSDCDLKEVE